ncbi:folylpolyglutamate synthase [Fibrobacteria bacterium R8-3-H12]
MRKPQKSFKSIHIVGTNGKGSTALYLANILQAHGIKTGLFTSPHLVSIRERIKIDGKMISQRELNSILMRIEQAAKEANIKPSYFEILTAAAFLWFKEKKVQVAVLEAGLGGRLDCTKIADGNIVALTSIGLDHTEILGNTKEKILREKLGIAKKGAIIITKRKRVSPPLAVGNYGKIYVKNAELAWEVAKRFFGSGEWLVASGFNERLARAALEKSLWHGRMQMLFRNGNLKAILDGAHNPAAARELAKCLKEKNLAPLPCVFASLTDKDTFGVLKALKPHISVCHAAQIENSRARNAKELVEICKKLKIKTEPLAGSIKNFVLKSKSPVLITGSLYLVGKAISALRGEFSELAEFKGLKESPD